MTGANEKFSIDYLIIVYYFIDIFSIIFFCSLYNILLLPRDRNNDVCVHERLQLCKHLAYVGLHICRRSQFLMMNILLIF